MNRIANIKIKFRPSTRKERIGTVFYQVSYERKTRNILTHYRLLPEEWDTEHSTVILPKDSKEAPRASYLISMRDNIRCDFERLMRISQSFDNKGIAYSADDIVQAYKQYLKEYSLSAYMTTLIIKLKDLGRVRTSETYAAALRSFMKFRNNEDILLDCINADLMEKFEAWHNKRGVTLNTISFYTRILRAVYNRAVDENIIVNRFPFRHVFTGVEKTVKRALSLPAMKKIKNLDLSKDPKLDYARDMFILSFMLRGMSFVDMAYLRKSDLVEGYLTYRRRKTRQLLNIKWTEEMEEILKKYPDNPTLYLLPIITHSDTDTRRIYRHKAHKINIRLKKIAVMAGLERNLSLYAARHSWASVAKAKGIPLNIISEGMGHDSELTTRIYLANLDTSIVDQANALILKSLF